MVANISRTESAFNLNLIQMLIWYCDSQDFLTLTYFQSICLLLSLCHGFELRFGNKPKT
jgi:hypothetical protein